MGYLREGASAGPGAEKAFSMEVGEVSEPILDERGYYHLIKVLDRRLVGFESQRDRIENRIQAGKAGVERQVYMAYLMEQDSREQEQKVRMERDEGVIREEEHKSLNALAKPPRDGHQCERGEGEPKEGRPTRQGRASTEIGPVATGHSLANRPNVRAMEMPTD